VAYELRGQFLEACDCRVMCPCWFEEHPEDDECTGLMAWHIVSGSIDRVDVSGLAAVSVSHHSGHRREGHARVALFVDERGSDEQRDALAKAFSGDLGGPLGELAEITQSVEQVKPAAIRFTSDGKKTRLTVKGAADTEMTVLTGAGKRVITLADSAMAVLLGPVAEVGKSSRFKLDLGSMAFNRDTAGRSANLGRFQYRHTGRSRRR
jgi:hypothetical protein